MRLTRITLEAEGKDNISLYTTLELNECIEVSSTLTDENEGILTGVTFKKAYTSKELKSLYIVDNPLELRKYMSNYLTSNTFNIKQ